MDFTKKYISKVRLGRRKPRQRQEGPNKEQLDPKLVNKKMKMSFHTCMVVCWSSERFIIKTFGVCQKGRWVGGLVDESFAFVFYACQKMNRKK